MSIPGPMEDYNGETVLYATGYKIDDNVIKQHLALGLILSLTIIGMVIGVPLILRGWYLRQNIEKAIIITKQRIYESVNGQQTWSTPLDNIENVLWRSSLTGLFQMKIVTKKGLNKIIKGNFYENEFHIIVKTLHSEKPT